MDIAPIYPEQGGRFRIEQVVFMLGVVVGEWTYKRAAIVTEAGIIVKSTLCIETYFHEREIAEVQIWE